MDYKKKIISTLDTQGADLELGKRPKLKNYKKINQTILVVNGEIDWDDEHNEQWVYLMETWKQCLQNKKLAGASNNI